MSEGTIWPSWSSHSWSIRQMPQFCELYIPLPYVVSLCWTQRPMIKMEHVYQRSSLYFFISLCVHLPDLTQALCSPRTLSGTILPWASEYPLHCVALTTPFCYYLSTPAFSPLCFEIWEIRNLASLCLYPENVSEASSYQWITDQIHGMAFAAFRVLKPGMMFPCSLYISGPIYFKFTFTFFLTYCIHFSSWSFSISHKGDFCLFMHSFTLF